MVELITLGVGVVFVVISFVLWLWAEEPSVELPAARIAQRATARHAWRGVFFVVWTVALPLGFLGEWYVLHPQPQNLAAFQYGHKVVSDVWTAFTVVLGLLFGLKKS